MTLAELKTLVDGAIAAGVPLDREVIGFDDDSDCIGTLEGWMDADKDGQPMSEMDDDFDESKIVYWALSFSR